MDGSTHAMGIGCRFFGLWLLATAAILVYGETAPSIDTPDFNLALASLGLGVVTYYTGCILCLRARRSPAP